MKSFAYRSTLAVLLLIAALPLYAGEGKANISLVSDYIFRGVSVSNGKSVLQGGYEYDYGYSIVTGIWASRLPDGSEYDIYAHYSGELGRFGYSTGVTYYHHTGVAVAAVPAEFNLALSFAGFSIMSSASEVASYNEAAYKTKLSDIGIQLHYGSDGRDPDYSLRLLKSAGTVDVGLVYATKIDSGTSIANDVYSLFLSKDF